MIFDDFNLQSKERCDRKEQVEMNCKQSNKHEERKSADQKWRHKIFARNIKSEIYHFMKLLKQFTNYFEFQKIIYINLNQNLMKIFSIFLVSRWSGRARKTAPNLNVFKMLWTKPLNRNLPQYCTRFRMFLKFSQIR